MGHSVYEESTCERRLCTSWYSLYSPVFVGVERDRAVSLRGLQVTGRLQRFLNQTTTTTQTMTSPTQRPVAMTTSLMRRVSRRHVLLMTMMVKKTAGRSRSTRETTRSKSPSTLTTFVPSWRRSVASNSCSCVALCRRTLTKVVGLRRVLFAARRWSLGMLTEAAEGSQTAVTLCFNIFSLSRAAL